MLHIGASLPRYGFCDTLPELRLVAYEFQFRGSRLRTLEMSVVAVPSTAVAGNIGRSIHHLLCHSPHLHC
jgi:hypothetical protein